MRRGLGKGLSALLSDAPIIQQSLEEINRSASGSLLEIEISQIEPNPYQPRVDFSAESLEELAQSIREQGIIQPITVRKLAEYSYQLIAGERRLQAARLAGLQKIPAYVRQANDEQLLEFALIENIQREDLNPIEIALAYQRLMTECNLTIEQVAEKVGKKRPSINNYLRLLKLPPEIQKGIRENQITFGHARALAGVEDTLLQLSIYQEIIQKGLSVRETEEKISKLSQENLNSPKKQKSKTSLTPYQIQIQELSRELSRKYNTKIQITSTEEGKGEIRMRFYSTEDLNRLIELLQ
ncbi:MAG: ParB/RepB/Spo0J family partition protein [Bacteroidia bacterium]|nr:ParB/RepB/Spo0J family partition protein [Bacteroidia bacterium]MDW8158601.1 ParB/RepB/Spo0J family partition protein [Bacteroidia bacterium]